jgi:hypothetical protein
MCVLSRFGIDILGANVYSCRALLMGDVWRPSDLSWVYCGVVQEKAGAHFRQRKRVERIWLLKWMDPLIHKYGSTKIRLLNLAIIHVSITKQGQTVK